MDQSYQDVFHTSLSDKKAYLRNNFVKLHGSVNWFLGRRDDENLPPSRHRGDVGVRIRSIAENMYNGVPFNMDSLEVLDPKHPSLLNLTKTMDYFSNNGLFYPLLFMPLTGKDYKAVSDFKDVMIDKALEMMGQVGEVYLIGYRANDELIHELLDRCPSKTKLHVIGLSSAKQISHDVLERHKSNLEEGLIDDKGFSHFISEYK